MLKRVAAWLGQASRVLIIFHESPDGDGIASSLALAHVLWERGKKVSLVCRDPVPPVFNFLPKVDTIATDFIVADYDVICTVDCGDAKRTGFPDRIRKFARTKKRLINIDHHLKNDLHKIANINLVDSQAAASAELVYQIINALGARIDKHLATLLLTGLFTDTGGFQHSNTTPRVFKLAAELLARGGQLRKVSKNVSSSKPLTTLQLWGIALERLWRTESGIVASLITQEDLRCVGAVADDIAGAVNVLNSIPQTKLAILLQEEANGKIKASLRTEEEGVNVAALAAYFGGGGHRKAAGFTVDGKLARSSGGVWCIALS
ncbi:MAG TPA: bifunctional oligoribonuclease/PAP phosphatase NrnA [Patescibacteria group bacterium]|nr:bifunctional oligoribonuclease/PAP phosphatase NrnA [Patescibacteria group bacterium]